MPDFPDFLVEAAKFERDTRGERYPGWVAQGRLTADEATVDYQCWCAITGWFETGHLHSIAGGIDGQTIVDWALAEDAAGKALASITAKVDRLFGGQAAPQGDYAKACARRASLVCIHRAVGLRRQSIESINRELREQRKKQAVAA